MKNDVPSSKQVRPARVTTIKDVALAAGVSIKTVSRVLNNEDTVRPRSREKIEAAIAALGYRPNFAARMLKNQRSHVIGMLVPRIAVGFISRLNVAISSLCRDHGYLLITEAADESDSLGAFVEGGAALFTPDAVIAAPRFSNDQRLLASFAERGIRVVRLNGMQSDAGITINMADAGAVRGVVRHLIALGHTRIGFVGTPIDNPMGTERQAGYIAALHEAGLARDPALIMCAGYTTLHGADAAAALLAMRQRPTAIFAASDTLAVGALSMTLNLGYSVPGDVAVAGLEDSPVSRAVYPPLTCASYPIREIAKAAVAAATDGVVGPYSFNRDVIVRGSTTGVCELVADIYGD